VKAFSRITPSDQGDASAQYNIGVLYYKGWGVRQQGGLMDR
jgi:TPR repeat protein